MRRRPELQPLLIAIAISGLALVTPPTTFASQAHADEGSLPGLPANLPASAVGKDAFGDEAPHLEARLLISGGDAKNPSKRAGVLFSLAPGWHLYWRNPGDTGLAPQLNLEAEGYQVGEIQWPAPEIFEEADGLFTTFGYTGNVLLSVPLIATGAADEASGAATVVAHPKVLVCRTECVPAEFALTSPLEVQLPAEDQARIDQLFADAWSQVPVSNDELGLVATAHWIPASAPATPADQTQRLSLRVDACGGESMDCGAAVSTHASVPFLGFEDQPFELSDFHVVRQQGSAITTVEMDAFRQGSASDRLRGVLLVEDRHGRLLHVSIDIPIEDAKAQQVALTAPVAKAGFLQIMLLALLGGLILNAMPCVLPVLAIKVVAIAHLAEKDAREVRHQGLAYTAGVLASMAILAAIVIALRSAGHSVGWGFQFQEPLFVAAISAVLVAFALNLFGVFEIELGQGRLANVAHDGSAVRRSVFEGLLAVVLATPCTAPFLGTAVGFAFAASSLSILTIFLSIGFGLALPFLAVSFVPGLARFIPRSGPWMMKLRAGLGFSLLATVVWLLWIVGQSGGTEAVIGLVATLLLLAFLLWAMGQAQPLSSPWLARISSLAIVAIAFAGFNLINFAPDDAFGASAEAEATDSEWSRYSESAVAEALAEGRTAFVMFTADWCITCKLNEKTVLDRASIRDAFVAGDIALFKADWTHRNERIRSKLAEFGRAGVPLYLVYSPEHPDRPQVLSELLSGDEVRMALARSAQSQDRD